MACDPTLGGSAMDAQCEYSNDLYCSCDGVCLPTDAAILPTGPVISTCAQAKQDVAKIDLKDLSQIDVSSLTAAERTALATFQCCTNCDKGARVSGVGYLVNCADKTISQATLACGAFATDPLALQNCPRFSTSEGHWLGPFAVFVFAGVLISV